MATKDDLRLIETLRAENARLKTELEAARRHEERLHLLEKTSLEPLAIFDENIICHGANRALLDMFGYDSEEEVLGKSGEMFVAPESRDITRENATRGYTEPYEAMMLRKDGTRFPGLIIGRNLEYEGRRVRVAVCRDLTEAKHRERELERAYAELDTIFNFSMVGIAFMDGERIFRRANQRVADYLGYVYPDQLIGLSTRELHFSDEDFVAFGEQYLKAVKEQGYVEVEHKVRRKDGAGVWLSLVGKAIDSASPPDLSKGIVWIADDITRRREDQRKLERANAELESFFSNSMVGVVMLRGGRMVYRVNQRIADILGYDTPDELVGRTVDEFHLSEEKFVEFGEKYYNSLVSRQIIQVEYQLKRQDGSPVWVIISGKAVDQAEPPDLNKGVVWIIDDITDRKKAEEKLLEMATTDVLTGVNNRRRFLELGRREFDIRKRHSRPLCMMMLDLDRFKTINDTCGHSVGDSALRLFASVCMKSLRSVDIIGRLGGEEFGIVLPDTEIEQAVGVAERIRADIIKATPLTECGVPGMTVSIGVASAGAGEELEAVLHKADVNLYMAKEAGRNRVEAGG